MIKKLSLIAACLLLLTACGVGSVESGPVAATPVPSRSADSARSTVPSASPSPPPTSGRGNLIKEVDETASMSLATGEKTMSFILTNIGVDAPCTSPYASPAENGHYVALGFDVETTSHLTKDINQFVWFGASSWKLILEDGTTYNGSLDTMPAYGCVNDDERIPSKIGPGEKVSGTLILDVPSAAGTLVFEPAGVGGWEWDFPAS